MFWNQIHKSPQVRLVGYVVGSVAALSALAGGVYLLEPKDSLGNHELDVVEAVWEVIDTRGSPNPPFIERARTSVVLPNGDQHSITITALDLNGNGRICATIKLGRWFGFHHAELARPPDCS